MSSGACSPVALVFDLDGTLVDSIIGIDASARVAIEKHAPHLEMPSLRAFIGPPIRTMLGRALNLTDASLLDLLEAAFREHYDNIGWRESPAYPGVVETLKTLQVSGARLYVLTNKPALPAERILHHLGLARLFTEIVTPDSREPRYRSKAEAALTLRSRLSSGPDKTILVGDSEDDAHAAAAAGFVFAAAAWGYGRVHLLTPPPAYSLANLPAIHTLISAISS